MMEAAIDVAERQPEHLLVQGLRRGDERAYEALVRSHGGRMLAVARRLAGSESDARDVVQEAFVSAFRSIDGFREGAGLATWLHRIVVNSGLMRRRALGRRPEGNLESLLPEFADDGHFREPVDAFAVSAAEAIERREVRLAVRAAVERLPEAYRTVVVLREIEERDTAETALLLGISENAVKIRLHRARQALATLLGPTLSA